VWLNVDDADGGGQRIVFIQTYHGIMFSSRYLAPLLLTPQLITRHLLPSFIVLIDFYPNSFQWAAMLFNGLRL
jgi:hypothetical protein